MADDYEAWSKAQLAAELRSRGTSDRGTTRTLRERLREDDAAGERVDTGEPEGGAGAAGAEEREAFSGDGGAPRAETGRDGEDALDGDRRRPGPRDGEGPSAEAAGAPQGSSGAGDVWATVEPGAADRVLEEVREITGREVEAVAGIRRTKGGLTAVLDLVDLSRIPVSVDLISSYEVSFDRSGRVRSCRRIGRYVRGRSDRRTQPM